VVSQRWLFIKRVMCCVFIFSKKEMAIDVIFVVCEPISRKRRHCAQGHPDIPLLPCQGVRVSLIVYFATVWIVGRIMIKKDVDDGSRDDVAAADMRRVTLGALACCVAEALPFGNDNLLIPLITAAAVQVDC
jgi:hypothetical protein